MPSKEYNLRKAKKRDLKGIHPLEQESFSKPWTMVNLETEYRNSLSRMFVIEQDNQIIAYCSVWIVKDEVQLNKIAVKPEFRKRGLGRWLIEKIEYASSKKGAIHILLEVREKNTTAISFYEKLGFIKNGLRKNYYRDDNAVLMKKEIPSMPPSGGLGR